MEQCSIFHLIIFFVCLTITLGPDMIVTFSVFMLALLLSLILVAVNIGQIITMIVPLINAHATPDSVASSRVNDRVMKCGVGAEATAVSVH